MFRLSEKSYYDTINFNLKKFLKCSSCKLVRNRLSLVCNNGHFFCDICTINKCKKWRCSVCNASFSMDRLTLFNSLLEVMQHTPVGSNKFIEKLVEVLECPVCYEETLSTLTICSNGHGICGDCSLFADECPLCRGLYVPQSCSNEIKWNLVEALLDVPCYNQENGCESFNNYNDLVNHINKCRFASWNCEENNCSWSGIIEAASKHAKEIHPNNILKGKKVQMTLLLDNNLHLQLWNIKTNLYKVFYKLTEQGLKLAIYCPENKSEKVALYLNHGKTSSQYFIPCIQQRKNLAHFITNECPTIVPAGLVKTNKPFLVCLPHVEEKNRLRSIVIFIFKVALMMIKFLTI